MYLTFDKLLKNETDETVIATLKRKGWQETFQPTYDSAVEFCIWQNGEWVIKPIPEETLKELQNTSNQT